MVVRARSTAWRAQLVPREMPQRRDKAVRLPSEFWVRLADDPAAVAAYWDRVYIRPGRCWPWLGPVSEDGQAKLAVTVDGQRRMIAAPVFGYQISRGLLRPGRDGRLPVIRHTCDESACQNPAHWILGTRRENAADYRERIADRTSPLADRRGPGARSRAIRDAIIKARKSGSDEEQIERVILAACQRGMPGVQDQLF